MKNHAMLSRLTAPSHLPLLGKVVSWSLGSVELTRDELLRRWMAAGLDERKIPAGIRPRSCVLRTLEELEVQGFTRHIVENPQEAIWVLVDERIDTANADVEFAVEQRLIYDKKSKTLNVGDAHYQATVDALMERFAVSFLTADVRTLILDEIKASGALTLRDNGGTYFLPPQRFDLVNQLAAFIEALGPACSMLILNVPETQNDVQAIFRAFESEFIGDMEALGRDLDDLAADGDRVRASTWLKRLQEFKGHKAKAEMFAELLAIEATRYTARVAELESRVKAKLIG